MSAPTPRGRRTTAAGMGLALNPTLVDLLRTELQVLIAQIRSSMDPNSPDHRYDGFRERQLSVIVERLDRLVVEEKDDDGLLGGT